MRQRDAQRRAPQPNRDLPYIQQPQRQAETYGMQLPGPDLFRPKPPQVDNIARRNGAAMGPYDRMREQQQRQRFQAPQPLAQPMAPKPPGPGLLNPGRPMQMQPMQQQGQRMVQPGTQLHGFQPPPAPKPTGPPQGFQGQQAPIPMTPGPSYQAGPQAPPMQMQPSYGAGPGPYPPTPEAPAYAQGDYGFRNYNPQTGQWIGPGDSRFIDPNTGAYANPQDAANSQAYAQAQGAPDPWQGYNAPPPQQWTPDAMANAQPAPMPNPRQMVQQAQPVLDYQGNPYFGPYAGQWYVNGVPDPSLGPAPGSVSAQEMEAFWQSQGLGNRGRYLQGDNPVTRHMGDMPRGNGQVTQPDTYEGSAMFGGGRNFRDARQMAGPTDARAAQQNRQDGGTQTRVPDPEVLGLPLSPEYIAAERGLRDAFAAELFELGVSRDQIPAQVEKAMARLKTDQGLAHEQVDESANARGLFDSSVRSQNRAVTDIGFTRNAQDIGQGAAAQYADLASREAQARGRYRGGLADLLTNYASSLYENPGDAVYVGDSEYQTPYSGFSQGGGKPRTKTPSKPSRTRGKKKQKARRRG